MSKGKLQKFDEFRNFSNTLEYKEPEVSTKMQQFLKKKDKTVLELGCGRGDYTISLAHAGGEDTNYIGVDIQGERLWHGAKYALDNELNNVLFFRGYIENLLDIFPIISVDDIWITFPDPFPKARHAKRRLTSPRFLSMYQKLLKPNGTVNLKTDNTDLLEYSLESAKSRNAHIRQIAYDIYDQKVNIGDLSHQTHFEKKHLKNGRKIKYLSFRLDSIN